MFGTDCIAAIEQDYQDTLARCRRVTPDTIWQGCERLRPVGFVLKALTPLM